MDKFHASIIYYQMIKKTNVYGTTILACFIILFALSKNSYYLYTLLNVPLLQLPKQKSQSFMELPSDSFQISNSLFFPQKKYGKKMNFMDWNISNGTAHSFPVGL